MSQTARLPNAPLAEVVFEMRWGLQGAADVPPSFHVDPGFSLLADEFTRAAQKAGFPEMKELHAFHELMAYGIVRRFYKAQDRDFPLWQIGPGIFAVNDSSQYEWDQFKEMVLRGTDVLLSSYPKMRSFALRPIHLELRYIDIFDQELVGTVDLLEFASAATHFDLALPAYFAEAQQFDRPYSGRFALDVPVKRKKGTNFRIDFGSGQRAGQPIVRLESKVLTTGESVPTLGRKDTFIRKLSSWLQNAHNMTSPFFRSIVRPEVMTKFE